MRNADGGMLRASFVIQSYIGLSWHCILGVLNNVIRASSFNSARARNAV